MRRLQHALAHGAEDAQLQALGEFREELERRGSQPAVRAAQKPLQHRLFVGAEQREPERGRLVRRAEPALALAQAALDARAALELLAPASAPPVPHRG